MALNGRREMRPTGAGSVFGVGRQVFVNGAGTDDRASMVDDKGDDVASLPDGSECEVLGWVPRGGSTRYLVRSVEDQREGWLGVGQLRASREPQNAEAPPKGQAASWVAPREPERSDDEPKRRRARKVGSV